ncbi:MAG: DUF1295 domain-containing protein [Bacteroidales bacterium]|jgi:steroid 5-alpha reductase family enzyme|nr:DUF1295 domain-containing protein [Bacteroidales bacterium]
MVLEIALVIFLYMTLIFIVALIKKNNSIADTFWGIGFILVTLYAVVQSGETDLRKMIVCVLVLLWGIRLSHHIMMRNMGNGENFRYKKWRETWKWFIVRSYFQIFMLQGFFMLIISAPLWYIGFNSGGPLGIWDSLGLLLFGVGFYFEAVGDYQLTNFKNDPANHGKILSTGLWALTRHPNYFGESLIWTGFSMYSLSLPHGWYTLVSPFVITLLLRYVSGTPLVEKKFKDRPGWKEYKARTAPFIPFVKFF